MGAFNPTRRNQLDRPGLGLGRSELQNPRENAESLKLVTAYKNYIKTSAKLMNFANASRLQIQKDISDMMRFESRLARGSAEAEDRRDHFGLYNKMTIRQLQQRYPGVGCTRCRNLIADEELCALLDSLAADHKARFQVRQSNDHRKRRSGGAR